MSFSGKREEKTNRIEAICVKILPKMLPKLINDINHILESTTNPMQNMPRKIVSSHIVKKC